MAGERARGIGLLFVAENFRGAVVGEEQGGKGGGRGERGGQKRRDEKIDESFGRRCDKFSAAPPTARKSPRKLFEGNDRPVARRST